MSADTREVATADLAWLLAQAERGTAAAAALARRAGRAAGDTGGAGIVEEGEGMKTYQHNGEYWYIDAQPLWLRVVRWLVSTGLDMPYWGPEGYGYRMAARRKIGLSLRARGHRSRRWALFHALCPLALFGHKIVFQSFGVHISRRRDYLCIQWPEGKRREWRVYASRDATPTRAHWWLTTPPRDVLEAARATVARRNAEREARS